MANRKTKVVVGTWSDLEVIESTSSKHDVVINAATSDDLELTKAVNRGLAKGRKQGRKGVLVHVSGVQVIETGPIGCLGDWPVFDDMNVAQIMSIPNTSLHRLIDLEVVRADLAGEITASIICPGNVFGKGTGPDKVISSIFPRLVQRAMKDGRVYYAGDGTNVWADVHVQETADLIMLSLRHNLTQPPPAGFARFYFAENGEHQKLALCKIVAKLLSSHSFIPSTSDTPLSAPLDSEKAPQHVQKTTARCVGNRGRRDLGWSPKVKLGDVMEEEFLGLAAVVKGGL